MDTNDIKHSPLITVCVIIPLIYLIMLSATMLIFSRSANSRCDISRIEPQIEYFNIHISGGFSTHNADLTAYTDGGRYYLEFNDNMSKKPEDHVKYELTKTEYLLCTNIDIPSLEEYPGAWAYDMFEHTLTIKEKGKEEKVIEKKIYMNQTFGLCRQIFDMKQKAPEGDKSYDTFIKLASYLYSCDTNYAWLKIGRRDPKIMDPTFNGVCINKKHVQIPAELAKRYSDLNCLFKEPKTEKGKNFKEEYLKNYIQTDLSDGTAYLTEVISESEGSLGFILAIPEQGLFYLFYGDIPQETEPQQYLSDVHSIITGKYMSRTAAITAISAETALFSAVMFFAAEKARRRLLTDRETSADDSDKEVTA